MMRLKPAIQYSFRDAMKGVSVYLFVILCIYVFFSTLTLLLGGSGSVSGVDSSSIVFCFVMGIVSVRDDLRFLLQNGCGRRTAYVTQIVMGLGAALAVALGLSLIGELFHLFSGALPMAMDYSGFYSTIAGEEQNFLLNVGFIWLCCLPALALGMFISLVYYRLTKGWKIAVSIGVPGFLFIGLPLLLSLPAGAPLLDFLIRLAKIIFASMQSVSISLLVAALLFWALSYPLIRRAPAK